jgi:metal-dependent amidase/aminoacylase/carboxypeptidase family protein
LFLTAIGLLRQQLRSSSRVHAIVVEGGEAVNVIPESARLKVFVRSPDGDYLRGRLLGAVRDCAEGAALATGTSATVSEVAPAYVPMRANPVLASLVEEGFGLVGRDSAVVDDLGASSAGSTDMGNVSEVVPSIHPYIGIAPGVAGHTREFEAAAGGPAAQRAVLDSAVMLGQAVVRLIEEPDLVASAWQAFKEQSGAVRDG